MEAYRQKRMAQMQQEQMQEAAQKQQQMRFGLCVSLSHLFHKTQNPIRQQEEMKQQMIMRILSAETKQKTKKRQARSSKDRIGF